MFFIVYVRGDFSKPSGSARSLGCPNTHFSMLTHTRQYVVGKISFKIHTSCKSLPVKPMPITHQGNMVPEIMEFLDFQMVHIVAHEAYLLP